MKPQEASARCGLMPMMLNPLAITWRIHKRDEQAGDAAEAAIGVDAAEDRRQDGDQQVGLRRCRRRPR